jgi:HAD superfamily hydrolase (TIGR01549 family)
MPPPAPRAVVFDMDGTITRPYLDFKVIRAAIGLPEPLLENMLALAPGPDRERAFAALERFEEEAAERSELNDDAAEILSFLSARGVPAALVTRNSRRSAVRVLEKHGLRFEVVVTREDGPVKPRPEPLWIACRKLDVPPARALMVGDFTFDVVAGRAAGLRTALLTNGKPPSFPAEATPDHLLSRLGELRALFA